MNKIRTKSDYINSLKNRNLTIYLMGELVKDPLTHPIIKPSIEAMAETYALADSCLLYTSPSPRDGLLSRMPSSA